MALQNNIELKVSHLTDQNLIQVCDIVSKYPPFLNYSFRLMLVKLFDQLQNQANVTALINNKIVAYAGWVTVNDSDAEKWFKEGGELPLPNWASGNSVIVTITVTESNKLLLPLMRGISHMCQGKKIYAIRSYNQKNKSDMRRPPIMGKKEF